MVSRFLPEFRSRPLTMFSRSLVFALAEPISEGVRRYEGGVIRAMSISVGNSDIYGDRGGGLSRRRPQIGARNHSSTRSISTSTDDVGLPETPIVLLPASYTHIHIHARTETYNEQQKSEEDEKTRVRCFDGVHSWEFFFFYSIFFST